MSCRDISSLVVTLPKDVQIVVLLPILAMIAVESMDQGANKPHSSYHMQNKRTGEAQLAAKKLSQQFPKVIQEERITNRNNSNW